MTAFYLCSETKISILKPAGVEIWICPYELKVKRTNQLRSGVLLKGKFADGKTGYADLHPWPEKGEAPLKSHLEKLRKGELTSLCSRALALAYEEAQARAKGINLLSSLKIPSSHYLINDIEHFCGNQAEAVLNEGFNIFKVKLKHPLKEQTEKLLNWMQFLGLSVKWRVDFHPSLSERQWYDWAEEFLIKINQQQLDFIESPVPYKENIWVRHKEHSPLALDVWDGENTLPVSVLVWKSSRKNPSELFKKVGLALFQRVVFTHSLSHPMEQLASAYSAARFYRALPRLAEICGLVHNDIYEKHDFTLPDQGPFFPCLSGPGVGL